MARTASDKTKSSLQPTDYDSQPGRTMDKERTCRTNDVAVDELHGLTADETRMAKGGRGADRSRGMTLFTREGQ
jgi:hypothetical protein